MAAPLETHESREAVSVTYPDDGDTAIRSAEGLFSFSLYGNLSKEYIHGSKSNIYVLGILAYLDMVRKSNWSGWRVVIHTLQETIDANEAIFAEFRSKGAIIGISTLDEELKSIVMGGTNSEGHTYDWRGITRINRYYPFFIIDNPVLVRDADTIFDKILEYSTYKHDEFVERLDNWEYLYYSKIKGSSLMYFSYDDEYGMEFNILPTNIWIGKTAPEVPKVASGLISAFAAAAKPPSGAGSAFAAAAKPPTSAGAGAGAGADAGPVPPVFTFIPPVNSKRSHARFLAGIISKLCPRLPIELWNKSFNYMKTKLQEKLIIKKSSIWGVQMLDEMYLTNIIYQYCKANNLAGFFKLNYVSPRRYEYFMKEYFEKKYGARTNYNEKNKMINDLQKSFNPMRNHTQSQHFIAQYVLFNMPELAMHDDFFYNPLKNIKGERRPARFPQYYFGRRASRRHRKSRKGTLKRR